AALGRRRHDEALGYPHVVEEEFTVVADAPAQLGDRTAHEALGVALDQEGARPVGRLRSDDQQLREPADGLEVLCAVDEPRTVGLLDCPRLVLGGLGRLHEVVETVVGVGLMDADGGEEQRVVQEFRQEVGLLLRRHADLEPVARAPGREHEVVGRPDLARSELFGYEAGREVVGHAGAAVLLGQHEGAEAELGALLEQVPWYALLPLRLAVERHRLGLQFLLREVARQSLKFPLLVGQSDIEHDLLALPYGNKQKGITHSVARDRRSAPGFRAARACITIDTGSPWQAIANAPTSSQIPLPGHNRPAACRPAARRRSYISGLG